MSAVQLSLGNLVLLSKKNPKPTHLCQTTVFVCDRLCNCTYCISFLFCKWNLFLNSHSFSVSPQCFQANAIGRGAKSVREFLEKNYTDEAIETDDLTIKLVIKALLEVRLFDISSVAFQCVHIHLLNVNMGKSSWMSQGSTAKDLWELFTVGCGCWMQFKVQNIWGISFHNRELTSSSGEENTLQFCVNTVHQRWAKAHAEYSIF